MKRSVRVKRSTTEVSGDRKWHVIQDPSAAFAAATEPSCSSRARSALPTSVPVEKRNFPPGQHGQSKKIKKVVGYGLQLREKQKAKRIYFTLETQFRAYYEKAASRTGVTGELLLQQLETRLDNVCYRMGFAMSRRQSRQVVRHGHVQVNGRKVNIPSFQCKVGDVIEIREASKKLVMLETAKDFVSGQNRVQWIEVAADNLSGKVIAMPKREDVNLPVNEQLIVELYSK